MPVLEHIVNAMKPSEILFIASKYNLLIYVKKALIKGADINIENDDGKTALMEASKYGHIGIVAYLTEYGADLNIKDKDHKTAIMFASMNGHFSIVKYLAESRADVFAEDKYGNTAYHVTYNNSISNYLQTKMGNQVNN